jgi:transposase
MIKRKQGQVSREVRGRTIRLVREQTPHRSSEWAAMGAIGPKLGCTPETLRRWVRKAEEARLMPAEEDRLKVLERENRELRQATEIMSVSMRRRSSTGTLAGVGVYRRASP